MRANTADGVNIAQIMMWADIPDKHMAQVMDGGTVRLIDVWHRVLG
jgi:hypothetical protein